MHDMNMTVRENTGRMKTEAGHPSTRHITLIRPPVVDSISSFSTAITAPLTQAYLAASLLKAGFRVCPVDALGEALHQVRVLDDPRCRVRGLTIEEIVERIPSTTDIIAVSCMFTQEWLYIRKMICGIKKAFPKIPIVLGGEHASAMPEEILRQCEAVDLCAIGEGEETIVDIARHFPFRPERIAGIVYRSPRGEAVRTPRRKRIQDIDAIPRPAWKMFPIENYLDGGYRHGINVGRAMPMIATRGCPFQCTFCSSKDMWTQRYYTRDPQDVIDEIKGYVRDYHIDSIEFVDLTAIIKREWILEFGRLLKEHDLKITWSLPSGTRSEALDEEVMALLAETNCRYFAYAAESGSKRILKQIKKQVDLDRMVRSMKAAKKNGINVRCNLILGFPDERRLDVWRTLLFQVKLAIIGVDDAPLFMFAPYPGSAIFDELRRTGEIKELDDRYIESLMCQMDLVHAGHFCRHIGKLELGFYRTFGMSLFYILSYLLYPHRIVRSIRAIFFKKPTITSFEERVRNIIQTSRELRKCASSTAS